MVKLKSESGITLIALMITIIVITILAGISLNIGWDLIQKAGVESFMTNMITIKSNAKVYAEEVNAEIWDLEASEKANKRKDIFQNKYHMSKVEDSDKANAIIEKVDSSIKSNGCEAYEITKETFEKMGLTNLVNKAENGEYVVVYNTEDFTKLEIVYPSGIDYEDSTYWTLSELQAKIEE